MKSTISHADCNMTSTGIIPLAMERCLRHGWEFVLYRLPDTTDTIFYADPSKDIVPHSSESFFCTPYRDKFSNRICIRHVLDADEVLSYDGKDGAPFPNIDETDTPRDEYICHISMLIDKLRQRGGKTVISRLITGQMADGYFHRQQWDNIFRDNPKALCALFATHEYGIWMVISPEVLVDYDNAARNLRTMSLAGTRPADTPGAWDDKNRNEQAIVTDYISNKLAAMDIRHVRTTTATLRSNNVEHLCTTFTAHICPGGEDAGNIIDTMQPTPAVCGYPVDHAVRDISAIERHERRLYSGCYGVDYGNGRLLAHVTLRCAHLDNKRYAVYAGGGITSQSNPSDEWLETSLKAAPLTANLSSSL